MFQFHHNPHPKTSLHPRQTNREKNRVRRQVKILVRNQARSLVKSLTPRQRGYGSTSSLRNDSLKHTRKNEKGREEPNQEASTQALADRPARRGGPSALATRTVWPAATDCPLTHRGPYGTSPRTVRKSKQNLQRRPRITDRPRGARGLSTRHPRTVRPLLRTVRNLAQRKLKATTDRKRSRARARRTREELARRGLSATCSQTVHALRTELKPARPRRSTSPIHHRISQPVEAVETKVWGHDMRQPRMLYPKNFVS
jgi:hypothetical protein